MRYGRLLFVALVITGCSGDGFPGAPKNGLVPTEPLTLPRSYPAAAADTIPPRSEAPLTAMVAGDAEQRTQRAH
jgi:hypothetical protein